MKIFGTIYPFVESEDESLKLGRYVANYDFLKALLKYATFDEYHLFCMNATHFKQTSKRLLDEDIPNIQKSKVKLYLYDHLIKMISSKNYHVFHLGGWGYFFSGLVYLRNKFAKNIFPITGLIHSLNGKETNYHAFKMLHAPLMPYDTVICSSNAGKNVLQKIFNQINTEKSIEFKGKYSVIPLGIENKHLLDKLKCRKQEKLDNDIIRILTVGRISPVTKFDPYPLIAAISDIISMHPNLKIELIIAGGANNSEMTIVKSIIAEEKMQNYIKVISNFDNKQKDILYGSSDIYVSLIDNLQETFGISIIEAMNAGLPVIISDINGYKELVEEGETGYKITSLWNMEFEANELSSIMDFSTLQLMLAQNMALDLEQFKERVVKLAKDSKLRTELGTEAQKRVKDKYLWSKIIHQYETLWNNLYTESKCISERPNTNIDIFANNYLDAFSHYPTDIISENMLVKITERGKRALNSGRIPLSYNNIQPLINNKTCLRILDSLSKSDIFVLELSKQATTFELLWMSKYGLIKIYKSGEQVD